jgi:hypothetical protein
LTPANTSGASEPEHKAKVEHERDLIQQSPSRTTSRARPRNGLSYTRSSTRVTRVQAVYVGDPADPTSRHRRQSNAPLGLARELKRLQSDVRAGLENR